MEEKPLFSGIKGWIALAILSGLGLAAGLWMNRNGVNVEIDSSVTITAGLRFARGEGVSLANLLGAPSPLMWFPPLIPWLVAIPERLGLNIRDFFGVFNALAWGALTAWTGWLARRATGSPLAGLLAAGTVLTSGAMAVTFGTLYSEPPFLLFEIGALTALGAWWEKPLFRAAALAGLCVAGAWLARYVGVTLLAAGALVMLTRPGLKWGRRLAAAALFGAVSSGPIFAWHFWQIQARHASPARALGWHPITAECMREGVSTLASFILPHTAGFPHAPRTTLLLTGLIAAAAVWLWHRKTPRPKIPPLVGISVLFAGIYGAFLLVSISIADADTPLDARLLSIILPPAAIAAAWLGRAVIAGNGRVTKWPAFIIAAGLLTLHGISTWRTQVRDPETVWLPGDISQTLDALRAIPPDAVVFSDGPEAIYMAIRRKTERLPGASANNGNRDLEGRDFNQAFNHLKSALAARGGWVVYWTRLWEKDPMLSEKMLRSAVPVLETKVFDDGVVFHIAARK